MLISSLNRKLLRDLGTLRGQILTIALVVASGVAAFVTTKSAYVSLRDARATFYTSNRFADVFATLKRAPEAVQRRLEDLPGVAVVDTRVVGHGSMPLETMTEPAKAIVVGLPLRLNTVHLRSGRMPTPGRTDEAVVSDAFAEAHQIALGDELPLVLGGVRRDVRVVGVGLSPEYVMVLSPGDMAADNKRQGVLFMGHDFVAAAL
ncbi:MAG TPA: hypothetical protein RMH80_28485, partial [Polyangiaceae bacterium LLY-WYZ-15_(1-7)]|nr:hypothetical protein [Polyangiaceae bacterium LLY-WYZ-15_(1-7)]